MDHQEMQTRSDNRKRAFQALKIPEGNATILSLDGGGIRGILTLQLLKALENAAGIPCYELFDMVAGTSSGGIIAGLIAKGYTAEKIEELYFSLVKDIFQKRSSILINRFVNPPLYTKKNYKKFLKEILGDESLKEVCAKTGIDLLVTAKDVSAGEETYFTCFQETKDGQREFYGTYKDALIRGVLEATMSAPTYFYSLGRFVDGGVTTYNNPALAALMEAVEFSNTDKYQLGKISLFSFGTGTRPQFLEENSVSNPPGLDIPFWLNWIMEENSNDASDMQTYLLRSRIFQPRESEKNHVPTKIDFRRFQISLNSKSIEKLRAVIESDKEKAKFFWLNKIQESDLSDIPLDDVAKMEIMKQIGEAMVVFIEKKQLGGPFTADLTDERKRDRLISKHGNIGLIKKQMSNFDGWLDNQTLE